VNNRALEPDVTEHPVKRHQVPPSITVAGVSFRAARQRVDGRYRVGDDVRQRTRQTQIRHHLPVFVVRDLVVVRFLRIELFLERVNNEEAAFVTVHAQQDVLLSLKLARF